MKHFVQAGVSLTLAAPYALTSGQGALVGSIFGVANGAVANGAEVVLTLSGVFDLPKVSTDVLTVGAAVYWNNTSKLVTVTAAGNTKIGVAVLAAANPSGIARVRLNGSF